VGFGPHRQLLEAIERSIQRDIARNREILQGGSKALQELIQDRFEAGDGAQDGDLADNDILNITGVEEAVNAEEDCNSSMPDRHGGGKNAQHGKSQDLPSSQRQIESLKEQLQSGDLSKKAKNQIKNKIKNIQQNMVRRRKGENHSQREKR
jgi:hypothetical protein